ncbi:MAG: hypothetical protein AAFZ91_01055 [Pseudomonadota bacterium]
MTLEDHTDIALARGWDAMRGLVASLNAALTANSLIRVAARREALVLLRQAEALVRRAILIMALRLPEPKPRVTHPASAETLTHLRALPRTDTPAFPLTEPLPGTSVFWVVLDLDSAHAFHEPPHNVGTIGAAHEGGEQNPDEDQFVEPGGLIARLTALQHALEAPEKQARRMARWLTRQRRARETGPARLDPLKLGHPPTFTRQRRQKHPFSTQALIDLHHFARAALDSS